MAAPTPAPGGGSASAWAGALAAGLVEMSARIGGLERLDVQAAKLRANLLELADAELHAYQPVLAALRLPAADPGRPERVAAALSGAAQTPLAIAANAAEVAELALTVARQGKAQLRGDALAGLNLAAGACQAAARLVAINLAGRPEDPRVAEAARIAERAQWLTAAAASSETSRSS